MARNKEAPFHFELKSYYHASPAAKQPFLIIWQNYPLERHFLKFSANF